MIESDQVLAVRAEYQGYRWAIQGQARDSNPWKNESFRLRFFEGYDEAAREMFSQLNRQFSEFNTRTLSQNSNKP